LSLLGATAAAAATTPVPECSSGTCVVTFPETGSPAAWTVPSQVSLATVTLTDGSGGESGGVSFAHDPGGLGATVVATIPVDPGDIYQVVVGGAAPGDGSKAGGYNGEAEGNAHGLAGGGGASDITLAGPAVLVAGGGGGAGGSGQGTGPAGAGGPAGGSGGASANSRRRWCQRPVTEGEGEGAAVQARTLSAPEAARPAQPQDA
jgi:hypothetical protein